MVVDSKVTVMLINEVSAAMLVVVSGPNSLLVDASCVVLEERDESEREIIDEEEKSVVDDSTLVGDGRHGPAATGPNAMAARISFEATILKMNGKCQCE